MDVSNSTRNGVKRSKWVGLILLVCLPPLFGGITANEEDDRRVTVGVNLFPAFLAADRDIAAKRDPDGKLLLLVVQHPGQPVTDSLVDDLRDKQAVRGVPIRVEIVSPEELGQYHDTSVAGIFIGQRQPNGMESLIRFGRERKALLFSPFAGDVERGVIGGIAVSDRILPYVNLTAMEAAGIRIKPFFLRIAERYESP